MHAMSPTLPNADDIQSRASSQATPMLVPELVPDVVPDLVPQGVAMLEEPAQMPGAPRLSFTPLEFYALSRVERTDVPFAADDALWLTEEDCPRIAKARIEFGGQIFFHEALMTYSDAPRAKRKLPLKIRYDRALLARGVLRELRVYHVEPDGRAVEICRCAPLEARTHNIDLNLVLRHRETYLHVLLSKVSEAQGAALTLEQGTAALERLRDEQAARERRQEREKKPPVVATPITWRSGRDKARDAAAAKTNALAAHLSSAPAAREGDADAPPVQGSGAAEPQPAEPPTSEVPDATRPETRRPARAPVRPPRRLREALNDAQTPARETSEAASLLDAATAVHEKREPATDEAPAMSTTSLAQHLGGTTGFHTPTDDD